MAQVGLVDRGGQHWMRALEAPFPWEDVEIKCQACRRNRDGNPLGLVVPYFNARSAMKRLDDIFSPECWQAEYREMHLGVTPGIICRLTVWPYSREGFSIVREDGAGVTDVEAFKGAVSSAFKRAFSALGARSFYDLELGWWPCEADEAQKPKFKRWTKEALAGIEKRYSEVIR